MKFYLCHTPEGRKRLVTRQDEAKKLDKTAKQIDIPVDQAGIKAGYEELFDRIYDLENQISGSTPAEVPEEEPSEAVSQPQVATPPARPAEVSVQSIHEWILDHATVAQVEQLFSRIGTRFAEFVKDNRS